MNVHRGAKALCSAVLVLIALAPSADGQEAALSPLTIIASDQRHDFEVEVATTPQERARGLMYREELPAKQGMLFDFGREQMVSMWMRNTLISLDMLFIGADGTIRRIASGTTPMSLETISSGEPVKAVLELNAGITRLLGIRRGDRVVHPIFKQDPASPPGSPPRE